MSEHTSKTTKIMSCNCPHDYQDNRYGKNMRVHNPKKEKKYSCTVCGKIKSE